MQKPEAILRTIPHLFDLAALLPGEEVCYLVGGALRDALLGVSAHDFDFATPGDPTRLARGFSARVGGRWFFLDRARCQSRVVLRGADGESTSFDFAPFRAADLDGDLRGRDFTANALALELRSGRLHDPLGGAAGIAARHLVPCAKAAFRDDPLRILRGARLAAQLEFTLPPATLELMAAAVPELPRVAGERLGDEVVACVEGPRLGGALAVLAAVKVLGPLFGAVDGLSGALAAVARIDQLRVELAERPAPRALLDAAVGRGFSRHGRLRLAALLRHLAPPGDRSWQERLCLGRDNSRALAAVVATPADQGAELAGFADTERARALWVAARPAPEDRLLWLAALTTDPVQREQLLAALDSYLALNRKGRIPDLVDGDWLQQELGIPPGTALGKALVRLRAAELTGTVQTLDQARKFLKSLGEKSVDKENGPAL